MKSIFEISSSLEQGTLTSEECVRGYIDKIKKQDHKINSFLAINEQAIESARQSDLKRKNQNNKEKLGLLEGVPIAIKDMICTEGLKTTAASKILSNYVPPYSATLVERLKAEGAIILGKNNMDEFAMGSTNENSSFGSVANPWNTEHVPGGSSGGSAACVAAEFAPVSIGTDTGGSIRLPASYCGLVGLKPTYGRVSRYGVIAYASSFDQAGPLTKTVRDSALLYEVIAGYDVRDATSSTCEVKRHVHGDVSGLKVGVLKDSFSSKVDGEVSSAVESARQELEKAGAQTVEIEGHDLQAMISAYYILVMSEASSNLSRYDGIRYGHRSTLAADLSSSYEKTRAEGFGAEVKRRILMGTFALSHGYFDEYYCKAGLVRERIKQRFAELFQSVDVILSPCATSVAPLKGKYDASPSDAYLDDVFTVSANLCGLPALSVPVCKSSSGLPIGVQLMGNRYTENILFDAGQCLEDRFQFFKEVPHGL